MKKTCGCQTSKFDDTSAFVLGAILVIVLVWILGGKVLEYLATT